MSALSLLRYDDGGPYGDDDDDDDYVSQCMGSTTGTKVVPPKWCPPPPNPAFVATLNVFFQDNLHVMEALLLPHGDNIVGCVGSLGPRSSLDVKHAARLVAQMNDVVNSPYVNMDVIAMKREGKGKGEDLVPIDIVVDIPGPVNGAEAGFFGPAFVILLYSLAMRKPIPRNVAMAEGLLTGTGAVSCWDSLGVLEKELKKAGGVLKAATAREINHVVVPLLGPKADEKAEKGVEAKIVKAWWPGGSHIVRPKGLDMAALVEAVWA